MHRPPAHASLCSLLFATPSRAAHTICIFSLLTVELVLLAGRSRQRCPEAWLVRRPRLEEHIVVDLRVVLLDLSLLSSAIPHLARLAEAARHFLREGQLPEAAVGQTAPSFRSPRFGRSLIARRMCLQGACVRVVELTDGMPSAVEAAPLTVLRNLPEQRAHVGE